MNSHNQAKNPHSICTQCHGLFALCIKPKATGYGFHALHCVTPRIVQNIKNSIQFSPSLSLHRFVSTVWRYNCPFNLHSKVFWWSLVFCFVSCCYGATIILFVGWCENAYKWIWIYIYIYAVNHIIALYCIKPKKREQQKLRPKWQLVFINVCKTYENWHSWKKTFYFPSGL